MNKDYEPDLITLLDDDNVAHEFEIIDEIEIDEGHFMALVPTNRTPEELALDPDAFYVYEIAEIDGEEELMEIEDDDIFNMVSDIFEDRFNDQLFDEE